MLFTKCAVVLKLCIQYNQCEHNIISPFQFEYIKIEYFDIKRLINNQCEHKGSKITTNNRI